MKNRDVQDALTWLVAVVLLISQATPWIPEKPYLIAGAFGLLGLPTIRKVQDAVNRDEDDRPRRGAET